MKYLLKFLIKETFNKFQIVKSESVKLLYFWTPEVPLYLQYFR